MAERLATILNVNDHEPTRYMVTRMLRVAGYDVLEAADGETALREASKGPDLIVLDVKLPDISGFEVCRMLKHRPETASIIVLQTSATWVTLEKKIEGLDSGADSYLSHPFEPAELLATVRALLRLRHAEQLLRQRAEALADADRRKDEFLAMLAHELRNPLAAISNALPLLDSYKTDPARFGNVRGVLERQTRHLARLIDDLLDVSRFTRGRLELRRNELDLCGPLADAVSTLRPVYEARAQELTVTLPEDGPVMVVGDASRLQQIFVNLLDNASKYSDKGSRVDVSLGREPGEGPGARAGFAVVRVKDQGVGIAPELLGRVFELFVQADESLERTRGGLGIGLTLVRRLVDLHGGTVVGRSDGIGRGSQFDVRIPLAERAGVVARSTGRAAGASEARSITPPPRPARSILIVEDNDDVGQMLQAFLEAAGHRVRVERDGPSGLAAALEGAHELALVDIGLPGLSGYEVAQTIRTKRVGGQDIYLVALTGYGGAEQRKRALDAGFDLHLVKPVAPDTLLSLIDELRRRPSPTR